MANQMHPFVQLLVFCAICSPNVDVQAQSIRHVEIEPHKDVVADQEKRDNAKAKLERLQAKLKSATRLARRGSLSKAKHDAIQLAKDVAALELELLRNPEFKRRISNKIARLKLTSAESRYNRDKQLFESGSKSKFKFRRTGFQLKIAQLELRRASGDISDDTARLLAANDEVDLAEAEWRLAKRLFERRSITKSTYLQLYNRLNDAEKRQKILQQSLNKKKQAADLRART